MRGTFRRSLNLGIRALRFYTLVSFCLVSGGLFVHSRGEDSGIWLAWCLAAALAAAIAGSLGAELRLISGTRFFRILPNARSRLAVSVLVLLGAALVPLAAITLALATSPLLLIVAAGLAIAFLVAGLWLGINGPIYLGLTLMMSASLSNRLRLDWIAQDAIVGVFLVLMAVLAGLSWRRFFGNYDRERNGSFRAWVWHKPEQAIGWRIMIVHVSLALFILAMITLPYVDPLVSLPVERSPLAHFYIGIAFVTTMMIGVTALNEAVIYRQRMRMLLMLPDWDRRQLHASMERGMIRLVVVLGIVPTMAILAAAMITGLAIEALVMLAALTISMQLLAGWGALALSASRDGGIAMTGMVGALIGSFVLLALLNHALDGNAWTPWIWSWVGVALVAAAGLRAYARRKWLRLSLESIDHWLLVRLAHQQWRADL